MGGYGGFMHWNGVAWGDPAQVNNCSSNYMYSLWGSSSTDVYAMCAPTGNGVYPMAHWNGTAWTATQYGTLSRGAWGSAADNTWFVGDSGAVKQWNGTTWVSMNSGASAVLNAVFRCP